MSIKKFDLFISYTHKQQQLVRTIASRLQRNQVAVWFDAWEMQPGDYLRERISSGIEQCRCMLVVMSSDALDSNWVKYELNCGFTSEIERMGLRVIVALAPEMTPERLPIDLRAKVYLDLRTAASVNHSIHEIIRLLNPYHYRRIEEAARLREEIQSRPMTVAELRDYLYGEYLGDLTREVELAVVRRLEKSSEPGAVLALAERAMSYSRIGVISRTLSALARRAGDGGMLAISATYTFDYRFQSEKLHLIRKSLGKQRVTSDLTPYEYIRDRSTAEELKLFCRHHMMTCATAQFSI